MERLRRGHFNRSGKKGPITWRRVEEMRVADGWDGLSAGLIEDGEAVVIDPQLLWGEWTNHSAEPSVVEILLRARKIIERYPVCLLLTIRL